MDDAELVERARRGDVARYEDLVRRYQDLAVRAAYLVVGDAAEAEDAAQEAFVKAFGALSRFQSDAPFRPWLMRIVVNEARNRRKADGRRAALLARAAREQRGDEAAPSPEAVALAAERDALLLRALDTLREEDRVAIIYRYFLSLSEAEMADALECARGTVKSRLARAGPLAHRPGGGAGRRCHRVERNVL